MDVGIQEIHGRALYALHLLGGPIQVKSRMAQRIEPALRAMHRPETTQIVQPRQALFHSWITGLYVASR